MARKKKLKVEAPEVMRAVNVGGKRSMVIELRGIDAQLDDGRVVKLGSEWPNGEARTFKESDAKAFDVHYRDGMEKQKIASAAEAAPDEPEEVASDE